MKEEVTMTPMFISFVERRILMDETEEQRHIAGFKARTADRPSRTTKADNLPH